MNTLEFRQGEIAEVLRRAGHEPAKREGPDRWFYLCVFHAERSGSMHVDGRKNTFKCFGCGQGGGIVALARQLNVEYSTADGKSHAPGDSGKSGRGRGRPSPEELWPEFAKALWTEDGIDALAVLRARGLTDETLRTYSIGVTHRLAKNEVGGGDWRITIPIIDESGVCQRIRRYNPRGKLRTHLSTLALVGDAAGRATKIKPHGDAHAAECPSCAVDIPITPAQAESEILCPSCAAHLFVGADTVKIWSYGTRMLYGLQMLADLRKAVTGDSKERRRVVIVGGEWDRLMMMQNRIPAITGTSGEGSWDADWTPLFDGLDVVVMLDADPPGQAAAAKIVKSLQSRSRCASLRSLKLPFRDNDVLPGSGKAPKDANDWFLVGHTADELLAAIDMAGPLALSFRPSLDAITGGNGGPEDGGSGGSGGAGGQPGDGPAFLIDEVRRLSKETPSFEKRRMIWEIVKRELWSHGQFMRTRDKSYYFFEEKKRRLHTVCDEELVHYVMRLFRLNSTEPEFQFVVAELEAEADHHGKLVRVRRFAHWVRETNMIYISQFDGNVARISDSGVEIVPNGADGVVFLDNPDDEPWTFAQPPATMPIEDAIQELMRYAKDIHFDEQRCPSDVAQRLLVLWMLSIFFGSGIKARPICTFLGEKGSGKTLSFQRFLQLCFGMEAEVTSVRHDNQDDMQAAVMSNILIVFDNVDNNDEFLNDELAKIATGMKITRRRLYSTLGPQSFRPDCFVGITAQIPHFTRSDVIDRMLLFRVKRRGEDGFEFGVVPTITDTDRSRFFSAVASIAMRVLAGVRDGARPTKSPYRLADWSTMAFVIGLGMGWPAEEMEAVVSATEWLRSDLQAEEDPLVDLILRWLAESELREGREYKPSELVTEWNAILDKERAKIRYHAKWVGRKIKDALPGLKKRLNVTVTHDEIDNIDTFRFERLRGDDAQQNIESYMAAAKALASMRNPPTTEPSSADQDGADNAPPPPPADISFADDDSDSTEATEAATEDEDGDAHEEDGDAQESDETTDDGNKGGLPF
jgi:hypothetical protein